MQLRYELVYVLLAAGVLGYSIPVFLLLRRAGITKTAAVILSLLFLVPPVNAGILYWAAWKVRNLTEADQAPTG